jgi:membrane protein DedA with SNARE-associated domain
MISSIVAALAQWVISTISRLGYGAIFFLMALDSFNIPIPSEVTMPFSGFLALDGRFSFWLVVAVGTAGSYAGSLLSYYLAGWLVKNRHRYAVLRVLLSDSFLDTSTAWFKRYGSASVLVGRVLPVIRTFISLPAGLGKMQVAKFSYLTIAGSFAWSLLLTYIGWTLGEHWNSLEGYFRKFDVVIGIAIVLAAAWWVRRHFFSGRNAHAASEEK